MSHSSLVLWFWPGVVAGAVQAALARAAAEEEDVQCIDTILVPEDEIVLCLVKGPSAQAVRAATLRSGLPSERVTPSIHLHAPERGEP